jgi:hypothetical protein
MENKLTLTASWLLMKLLKQLTSQWNFTEMVKDNLSKKKPDLEWSFYQMAKGEQSS